MYYQDGTKAEIGDVVVGPSDNTDGTIVGMVSAVATPESHLVRVRLLAKVFVEGGSRKTVILSGDVEYTSANQLRKIL